MLKPNQKKKGKVLQCIFTDEIYICAENYLSLDFFTTPVKC